MPLVWTLPLNVGFGVVDHVVDVVAVEAGIGDPSIRIDFGTGLDVLSYLSLKRLALAYRGHASREPCRLTIQQAHHDCFTGPARARNLSACLSLCMLRARPPIKDSSASISPAIFSNEPLCIASRMR